MTPPARILTATLFLVLAGIAQPAAAAGPDAGSDAFFETKVRPVLAERCYKCHSEGGKTKGGLRLDSRAALLAGGDTGPAVVPGDPAASRLVVAVGYADPDVQMPPKSKLPADEIAALTAWVKAGAPWPDGPTAAPATAGAKAAFDVAGRKAEHWAWRPVRPQDPPAVKDAGRAKDPLDRFVLAKVEEKGWSPAPPADRRALIRRLSFDLTGLPPTPGEVEGFVDDPSQDAVATVTDRLLASPHFGERWAHHWLDLVRYAETRGHEFDYDIPGAYQYRDYVIRAFNADVPYDRFVTEHVAGDLLDAPRRDPSGATNESVLGTGFWFLGEGVHSPVDIRDDECGRVDNQIDVFAKAFLGLTVACARCHDHKFDAISHKDYYALAGFLHSSSYRDVRFRHDAHNRDVLRRVHELDRETRAAVARAVFGTDDARSGRLTEYLLATRAVLAGRRKARDVAAAAKLDGDTLGKWVDEVKRAAGDPADPLHGWAVVAGASGEPDAAAVAERLRPVVDRWRTELLAAPTSTPAAGVVVVDYGRRGADRFIADGFAFGDAPAPVGEIVLGTSAGRPIRGVRDVAAADNSSTASARLPGMVRTPEFTISGRRLWYRVAGAGEAFAVVASHRTIAGPLHGKTKLKLKTKDGGWAWVGHDLADYVGHRCHVEFTPAPGERLAVAAVIQGDDKPPPEPVAGNRAILALLTEDLHSGRNATLTLEQMTEPTPVPVAELAARHASLWAAAAAELAPDGRRRGQVDGDRARLLNWVAGRVALFGYDDVKAAAVDRLLGEYHKKRAALLAEIKDSPTAPAMLAGNGFDERLLLRGSHKTPGDVVPRRFLEAVAGPAQPPIDAASPGRLQLARRMTDPANPLPARVMANRVWHHLLGRGLVASTDDFGVMGQPPTHPELLDHLADRLVRDGWSVKRLIRAIVLSATYQQSSRGDARAVQADPQNLLLGRANVRRLEGEAIRDAILAVSGRLDPALYGPSVEVHLTPFMDGRGRPKDGGPLDGAGRRSVYTKVRRNFLPPMMMAFDMPNPFNCIGRRTVSNVPAQALALLNDPFVSQQAKKWAERTLAEKDLSTRDRIARMYEHAFARPPADDETAAAEAFLEQQGEALGLPEAERATDARAWADLAHVLVNVKEFIFLN